MLTDYLIDGPEHSPNRLILADGDHSFKPRKASDITLEQNLHAAVCAIRSFIQQLT